MKRSITILGLTAASALLASCGGGDKKAPEATESTAAATETSAAAPAASATAAAAPTADSTDTLDGSTLASVTGNAANGKTVFVQCQACHSIEAGKNMIGPSLAGVVGRAAGTVAGFAYSDANKNSGITWSKEKLFQYLEKPARVVPGTKMSFVGLPKPQDRADVIAYLETGGK